MRGSDGTIFVEMAVDMRFITRGRLFGGFGQVLTPLGGWTGVLLLSRGSWVGKSTGHLCFPSPDLFRAQLLCAFPPNRMELTCLVRSSTQKSRHATPPHRLSTPSDWLFVSPRSDNKQGGLTKVESLTSFQQDTNPEIENLQMANKPHWRRYPTEHRQLPGGRRRVSDVYSTDGSSTSATAEFVVLYLEGCWC